MSSQANQPLPEGFQLENYRVLRLIASGGFSFVYLAHDENEAPVAIKEYLPATLALRTTESASPVVPVENLATFRYRLKYFFEEGRALATLGPWSDIYSIGASMYACLAGAAPPVALLRMEKDKMTSGRRACWRCRSPCAGRCRCWINSRARFCA